MASFLAVAAIGLLVQVVPRPTGWTLQHVHKEDGIVFLAEWLTGGAASLGEIYSGYLHFAPRLVSGACVELLPIGGFAACTGVAVALFKILGMVLAFPVFSTLLRDWRWGLAVSAVFLFLPIGQMEVLGNTTNMRWFGVTIVAVVMLGNFRNPALALVATAAAVLGALSDPLALFLAPWAIGRLFLARRWALAPSIGALIAMAFHIVTIRPSDRGETIGPGYYVEQPVDGLLQLLIRGPVAAQYGQTVPMFGMQIVGVWVAVAALLPLAVAVAATLRGWRRDRPALVIAWLLATWGIGLLAVTMSFATATALSLNEWWAIGQVSRYSALASLFLIPSLLIFSKVLLSQRGLLFRALASVSLAALAVSFAADFRGDAWNASGPTWAETVQSAVASCADGSEYVRVQFTPDNVEMDWSADLPCEVFTTDQ